ncbi:RNA polymerase sigma factor [Nakamurella multipartita]|uniref:RNA polymerase, sigma-24 subunit, ECF subfamily n=1 Tax=Nakamurella multipartita (strain ATCC 700099 / DSM 44233 / CIP 104796 / JCM 9543 / NBRC 105858 / Y-104) TaxID=479431 RepID=C8XGC0_NAKMY|nr:sigma-70 family RNA polymerase sigma factor [Nakamurella multipartita]ACV80122.1 RNA polymerase, sigma-24 subunit, ECF subfamily [Nakamurella multipartita DSM 44233]
MTRRGTPASGAAVGVLFERHRDRLRRYLTGRVGPTHADDLLSEVFLAACRRWSSFDPDRGSELAWLFGIATTAIRSHARDEARHLRRILALSADRPQAGGADESGDRVDAQRRIRRLLPDLKLLDPIDRDILLLIAWAGLSPAEVALSLDLPAATIRSRLHRARRRLRRVDATHDLEPEPSEGGTR